MAETAPASQVPYRPEIDGLRAIAVVMVLLYHAHLGLSGGFVGVDVFFVISGFLITSLLLKKIEEGDFQLADFWERRIRRIFPAVAVVTAMALVAGWFILLPADYSELARSATAQMLLSANVFFWRHTGYFAGGADSKPLLHLWSLGVEEQFYLLFPLLLLALMRFGRKGISAALSVLCLLSFSLSAYGVLAHPGSTFFLLPGRAWELGVGALLAASPEGIRLGPALNEGLAALGLGAIVLAAARFDGDSPFPGPRALLPCLGSAAFIGANLRQPTSAGRLLSLRPFVFVGLISYSLYLWHWPLLAFSNYAALLVPVSPLERCGLLTLAFVLAVLSWKFIELPFRRRTKAKGLRPFMAAALASAVVLSISIEVAHLQGVPARLPESALAFAKGRFDVASNEEVELTLAEANAGRIPCVGSPNLDDPIRIVLWGDSHAMAVIPSLDHLGKSKGFRVAVATHSASPPILGFTTAARYSLMADTPLENEAIMRFIERKSIPEVVLAAHWSSYPVGASMAPNSGFALTLHRLRAAGARVWLLEDVPTFPWDVPRTLAHTALLGKEVSQVTLPESAYRTQRIEFQRTVEVLSAAGVSALDPAPYLLSGGACLTHIGPFPLYRDTEHLTIHGAMLLEPLFAKAFSE